MGFNSTFVAQFNNGNASGDSNSTATEQPSDGVSSACFGISAVLRMSFSLFIFHAFIFLIIIPRNECASIVHDGFWCCKFMLLVALFTCFFFIHVDFFDIWMEICRYVSICFLLVQTIYMVSSSFSFNDYIKLAYSDDESCGNWILLLLSLILNAGSIAITSLCIVWFLGSDEPLKLIEGMQ